MKRHKELRVRKTKAFLVACIGWEGATMAQLVANVDVSTSRLSKGEDCATTYRLRVRERAHVMITGVIIFPSERTRREDHPLPQ